MSVRQKSLVRDAAPKAAETSKVAQRLLVHARLCRQMACASLDEAVGEQLLKLATECVREAAEILAAERVAALSDIGPATGGPAPALKRLI